MKRKDEERKAREDSEQFDKDFEKASKEAHELDEDLAAKKFALDELKHKIEIEEDAAKKKGFEE